MAYAVNPILTGFNPDPAGTLTGKDLLTERPGFLRLYGRESFTSCHYQSLLAHRQQSFYCQVTAKVDFEPVNFQQMAGMVYNYDSLSCYYFYITEDEEAGRVYKNRGAYAADFDYFEYKEF